MRTDALSAPDISATAFFTGHRRLSAEERLCLPETVFLSISEAYAEGYRRFICGCALGFDTIAALETVRLRRHFPGVVLSLAIPCLTQADRWPEKDRAVYRKILSLADEQVVLSPEYYRGAMLTRNRYMADRSSLCICYMTRWQGGTASAVRYALTREGMRIVNLAVAGKEQTDLLREQSWNCIYTSPSADKNAVTVPLLLSRGRKMKPKRM